MLGDRLKEIRENSGISQNDLATAINVNQSAISFWESGVNEPKATYVVRLCIYFNISADYLLGLSDIYETLK